MAQIREVTVGQEHRKWLDQEESANGIDMKHHLELWRASLLTEWEMHEINFVCLKMKI